MLTGQFGVVRTTGTYSTLIRIFQSLHHHTPPSLASYTHSFVAVSETELIEAWPGGARRAPISEYTDVLWSRFKLTDTQRDAIVRFNLKHLGDPYAWEDIPLIGLALATGRATPSWLEKIIANPHRWMCSAMTDAAYRAAGIHLFHHVTPAAVYPSMLAQYVYDHGWGPRQPGTLKGWT